MRVHRLFPFICKLFLQSKIKLFNVSISAKNKVITFAEAVCSEYFSFDRYDSLLFEILMYNDFASRETGYVLSGTKSVWLIFL